MAEGTFKNIIFGILITTLFTFLITSAFLNMSSTYEIQNNPLETSKINLTGINNTLKNLNENAEDWKDIFSSQTIAGIFVELVITGISTVAKTIWNFIIAPYFILNQILTNVIGIPLIITNVIYAIFILMIIFGLWRLYKQGD